MVTDADKEALDQLYGEWCEIKLLWTTFEELFVSGPDRIDLLNAAASNFFFWVDRCFFEAVIMSVCRLTDPVKSVSKANLTVKMLPAMLKDEADREEIEQLISYANECCKFHRDWRNRRLSHNDLNLKMGEAEPLETATVEKMNLALDAVFDVIQKASLSLLDQGLSKEVFQRGRGTHHLLRVLYDGNVVQEERASAREDSLCDLDDYPSWLTKRPQ